MKADSGIPTAAYGEIAWCCYLGDNKVGKFEQLMINGMGVRCIKD